MKNILGTKENLELFNENGIRVYEYFKAYEYSEECTYDSQGKVLTFKNSNGFSYECTYDSNGKELTFKDSNGFSYEYTYDLKGNELIYKNSKGTWYEYTRDSNGNELTFKNSKGVSRGFDIPEYTMEELVSKLGNFKIKK